MAVITSEMVLWKDLLLLTDMYFLLQLEEEGPSTGGFHDLVLLTAHYGGWEDSLFAPENPTHVTAQPWPQRHWR